MGECLTDISRNQHPLLDRTKQVQVRELHTQRCQTRTRGKMTFWGMIHSFMVMGLLSLVFDLYDRYAPSLFFLQVL
jgi:hypothetical protein